MVAAFGAGLFELVATRCNRPGGESAREGKERVEEALLAAGAFLFLVQNTAGLKIIEFFIDSWEIVEDAEAFSAGASSVVFIDRRIDGSAEARRQQVMHQIDVCDCSLVRSSL